MLFNIILQCGGCGGVNPSQVVQVLSNPLTWMLALAALSTVVTKVSGGGSKKK